MNLKRIAILIAGILIGLSVFSSCSKTEDNKGKTEDNKGDIISDGAIDASITVHTQEYEARNIVEILMLSAEAENSDLDKINNLIEERLVQPYETFKATYSPDDYQYISIEIQSYPFTSRDYLQIVTTYIEYPIYGTDGELQSYNFNLTSGRYVTVDEIMADLGLTDTSLTEKVREAYVPEFEGTSIGEVTAKGFLVVSDYETSSESVTQLLLEVQVKYDDSDSWNYFFGYIPETETLMQLDPNCLFAPDIMDAMDPPLRYGQPITYPER